MADTDTDTDYTEKKPEKVATKSLAPEKYIYTTNEEAENFNKTPFPKPNQPKNDLTPPPTFIDQEHDESDPYQELGFFNEENDGIFKPDERIKNNVADKPIGNLYEQKHDDTQMEVVKVINTKCRCKDGRVVMGKLDTSTGQKDCSNCNKRKRSFPNAYKNYRTKKFKPTEQNVPLRKQAGVSHMGDINLSVCNNTQEITKKELANNTLNNVVNVSQNSPKGATISQKKNNNPIVPEGVSIYNNNNTNIYGI